MKIVQNVRIKDEAPEAGAKWNMSPQRELAMQTDVILKEYSELPEYRGLSKPSVCSKSLFGDYPINIACTRGITEEILALLASGADINAKGEHGYTPLHNSVEQGHLDVVQLLLEKDADYMLTDDDGTKPIELAKLLNETKIYQVLTVKQEWQ